MDELFCKLREEFHIKPEDCPIFYLYDRDVLSYQRNELRKKYVLRTVKTKQSRIYSAFPHMIWMIWHQHYWKYMIINNKNTWESTHFHFFHLLDWHCSN